MSRDSLLKFSEAILNEAALQREELISGLKERRDEELSRTKKEFSEWKNEYIQSEKKRMEDESLLKILNVKNRAFRMIIETRQDMFDKVFGKVIDNINEYVKSDKYVEFLKSEFEKLIADMKSTATVCEVRAEDKEIMTEIAKNYENVSVCVSKSKLLGGFILENREMRIYIDNTLDRRIECQKEEFYKNCELIIEH